MSAEDPYIGKKIDEYRVESLLGKGAMGSVYKAEDSTLRRHVAIKVLAPGLIQDKGAVKRFEREARIIAEIDHPNIARIYRIGKVGDMPYYVMEYVEGKPLSEILKEKGRLSGPRSLKIILQAARALKAAAEHNIIHRDIKPANIMVTPADLVKVVDFGIAKAFADDTFKTATGTLLGTPLYMSPEQGRGAPADHRSDIYSLGATFYHIVTGSPPFESENPITVIQKHITEPVRAVTELNPNVPEKLCNLIYAMLAKNPGDRIQDYAQLIITLENLSGRQERTFTYIPQVETAAPALEDRRKARRLLIAAGAVIALLVIVSLSIKKPPEQTKATEPTARTVDSGKRTDTIREGLGLIREYNKIVEEEKK